MWVLNRNSYTLEKYGFIEKEELTPTEFAIIELLANGKEHSYYDITHWVQKRTHKKQMTLGALKTAISRLRRKGVKIQGTNFSTWFLIKENIWEN